jgi:ATP-binding cassette, subfamily B, bacterial HlyB/CyaB
MSYSANSDAAVDPGLSALVTILRFQDIGADPAQLRHRLGHCTVGVPEMLRCAKELGLKARAYKTNWKRLASTPMPSIAVAARWRFHHHRQGR